MSTSTPGAEKALRRSKRPRTPLAGPYGHPLHPLLVTVPIGVWVASLVFDIAGAATGDPEVFARGALWLIGIGIIGAVLAALFGLMDLSTLENGTRARTVALTHMTINFAVVAVFLISFLVRLNSDDYISVIGVVLSVLALVGLSVSGFLGGELAYRHGVRVADEETQVQGFGG